MLNADLEINYLYEAVPLMDQYLGSKESSWQLPGIAREPGHVFGALTIGVVLFMLKRLKARPLPDKQAAELGEFETRIFQSKIHNEALWMKKVGQDLTNRSRIWQAFLDDYRSDPMAACNSFQHQVSQRVIMQLLWEEQDTGSLLLVPLQFMLQTMDENLKLIFAPGGFIWDEQLQSGFPKESYWYLYGKLKNEKSHG